VEGGGGGGGEKELEGGVWRRIRLVDGGRVGGDDRILKKRKTTVDEKRKEGCRSAELFCFSKEWWGEENGIFPAALCTQEGVVAPLGLQARAGRRGGEAVRERGRRL
jgi:hypothetical protein